MTRPFTTAYVREITDRDKRRCVACCARVGGRRGIDAGGTWDLWHRIPHLSTADDRRTRRPSNLLTMCWSCIEVCDAYPLLARAWGYRLWRSEDPAAVAVHYAARIEGEAWPRLGERWRLDDSGGRLTLAHMTRLEQLRQAEAAAWSAA